MSRTGTLDLPDAETTERLGRALAGSMRIGDVVALSGSLGAGKTTLARGVLAGLGLEEEAPSPSYPLVIAYDVPELRVPLWHVDLYRIEDAGELDELGLDEVRGDVALLVEWPERMGARLWSDALQLTLHDGQGAGRRLTWQAPAAWEDRWPPARS